MRSKRGMREKLISFSLMDGMFEWMHFCLILKRTTRDSGLSIQSSSHPSASFPPRPAEHAVRCRLVIHEMEGLGHSARIHWSHERRRRRQRSCEHRKRNYCQNKKLQESAYDAGDDVREACFAIQATTETRKKAGHQHLANRDATRGPRGSPVLRS